MKALTPLAVALLVLAAPASDAAPRPDDKADKDGLKKLAGDWKLTSWKQSGQELPAEALDTVRWTVKGDKYTFQMGDEGEEGTLKVDPAKRPAAIDLEITSGNDKGKSQVGIYKIEADAVTFCFARPGAKDRPTEFSSTEDNGHILLTVKKKKDD